MKLSTLDRKRYRIKNKIKKVAKSERFRLCVSRSTKNISAQIIDDINGTTLYAASTMDKGFQKKKAFGGNISAAKEIGSIIAKTASKAGVKEVVFDRGAYLYHGRVKALAEAARGNGLVF